MTPRPIPLEDAVFSIEIRAPRQRVWNEITRIGSVSDILFHTILESELTPGAKLRYWSPDRKNIWIVGTVQEVVPPERFVHTYRFTDITDETETLVTWELAEAAGVTRVTLTHSRFTDQAKTHKKVTGGWVSILDLLKTVAEERPIGLKWKAMYWMMDRLGWMMPKSTRAGAVIDGGD
jgi:uncharacterized protein YndB with AHSA1/START domain